MFLIFENINKTTQYINKTIPLHNTICFTVVFLPYTLSILYFSFDSKDTVLRS